MKNGDDADSLKFVKKSVTSNNNDGDYMASIGQSTTLSRPFNTWSMLALAFNVLGTWSTFAQDLSSGLENGGAITILWGLLLVAACNLCVAISLGELCSAMPTALGQAYWVHRLASNKWGRYSSYMCAWINTFGWWALTASQMAFMTNFILGIKVMFQNDWAGASEGWVQFLVYVGIVVSSTIFNSGICRKEKLLPWFNNFIGIQYGALFLVFSLAMLIGVGVRADLHFKPGSFVFGEWINQTGWPDGVVWFTGLIQAAYGLTAFDSVIHMVEELPSPRTEAPRVIYLAVMMGTVTGGLFMAVCLACIQNLDLVLNSPTGLPFAQLVMDSIGLQGAAALLALFCFNGIGQSICIMTTASRLTWGFARDGGLPWSRYFAVISDTWRAPVRALLGQGVVISLIGILYLFSSTVLEAILSVSTIALTISYAMPIMTLLAVGRDKLPPSSFHLGRWGAPANWISVVYCAVTTVFFFFPSSPDPAPGDMNYAIAVFGVMLIIATVTWCLVGRRTYLRTDGAVYEAARAARQEVLGVCDIEGIEPRARIDLNQAIIGKRNESSARV